MSRTLVIRVDPSTVGAELPRWYAEAIQAGFDGVEVPTDSLVRTDGSTGRSDEENRNHASPTVPVGAVAALYAEIAVEGFETARRRVATWLELAGGSGARCLSIELLEAPGQSTENRRHRHEDSLSLSFGLLHRTRFEAERAGVALALEAGAGGAFTSAVELRDLIDAANSWAVGACVDVHRLTGLGRPEDWIRTLGRRLHAVRVPFTPRAGEEPAPMFEQGLGAAVDHAAIVSALKDVDYGGLIIATGCDSPGSLLGDVKRHDYPGAKSSNRP